MTNRAFAHGPCSILLPRATACCWCIRRCGITGRLAGIYRALVGGGARSHDKYGEFGSHGGCARSLADAACEDIQITDELYRFPAGRTRRRRQVLATGRNSLRAKPIQWFGSQNIPQARIVCITSPRRAPAHEKRRYQTIRQNGLKWAAGK